MAAVLDVAPNAFVSTAEDLYHRTFVPAFAAFTALSEALGGCRSMAGSDPAGEAWAGAYDAAVAETVRGWRALATAAYRAAILIDQCGRNHEAAESASRAGGAPELPVSLFDAYYHPQFGALPSGGGGASDAPTGWGLIEHAVGYVWPGGHQDRLRIAAAAWDAAAQTLDTAADDTLNACVELAGQRSPEVDDALHTIWGLSGHLHELAHACRALALSCRGLALHIDEMRSNVEHELISIGAQTVVIEGIGAVLSCFSFGTAEAPTQLVEGWRVREIASAVKGIIETFGTLVGELVESVPSIAEIAQRIAAALERLAGARIRVVEVAGAPGLRTLTITRDERITSTAMTAAERGEAGLEKAASDAHAGRLRPSEDGGVDGATGKMSKLSNRFGIERSNLREALHEVKDSVRMKGNPDCVVDSSGEVYPLGRDGQAGDSIGNIFDHLGDR